jgi:hypothetical protein
MNRHLSDDDLLDQLYGLGENNAHLESCGDCARRWSELQERRARLAAAENVSFDLLAAQRRKIYARLGKRPGGSMKWVPAVAAAGLLAIAALVYRPPAPVRPNPADADLFSDVYSMEQSTEPAAAAPIHGLFEDNQ